MRLTVVGCSGSFPTQSSSASCYLLEHDGARLLLDFGNGAMGALQRYVDLSDPEALAGIALSHCHVDHCADLATYFVLRHYGPRRSANRLPVVGPRNTRSRLAGIYGMDDESELDAQFRISPYESGEIVVGPFVVTAAPAQHPVEAYSIRVSAGGRSLVYSGDTDATAQLAELARGCDVALFEASFVEATYRPGVHLRAADAGRIAQQADVGTLVLTHHLAWNDPDEVWAQARAQFDGTLLRAAPGLTVDLDA